MASCRVRAAVHHDHASMHRRRRRSMPSARCMARQRAFTAGIPTIRPRVGRGRRRAGRSLCARGGREPRGRPRRTAVPGGSGRQYAPSSWRQEPPSAASSMPLRRGWKLRHATPDVFAVSRGIGREGAGPGRPEATFRRQCRAAGDGCSAAGAWTGGSSCSATGGRLRSALGASGRCHRTEAGYMRHWIAMILAAITTGVLFFPGPGGTCGSCAFPPRRPAWLRPGAGGGRRPRVAPCDADGLAHDRAGIVVRPALVSVTAARPSAFYPCGLMFPRHRRRCVSTVRWRASLTILAGVVLIAAEGRAS
jgi:hypothetical protein